ncbi:MAG: putative acyl esterase [Paracoccaceae bacterium]|jgi:predicted acyl esterase
MIRTIFVLTCGVSILLLAMLVVPAGRDWLRDIKAHLSFLRYQHNIQGNLQSSIMIPMPDGPRLATDIYLPDQPDTRLATILICPLYGKRRYNEVRHWLDLFLPHGFAVVVQDMRGRWGSEGVFAPYPNAAGDGSATLDWIVDQGSSNGRVGTIGCSALGESQILLAASGHPAHHAMIPIGAGGAIGRANGDFGYFGFF